ncbi:MAG: 16S rRNA (guanine(527)-N(7))-methyltransferase RsmG [Gammaproteobacteria bacterium]|nr:16S rRNA (guanine(527)-N(7))-methyltransferase RsmG [Gammaproteobacteria bacterium]
MQPQTVETTLIKGLDALDISTDPAPFLAYLALLSKWNQAYNLTAIRQAEERVTKHVIDALAVIPFIEGERILDVGSGAGCPGIPLAIYFPERSFVLLDSSGKKTRFLDAVKRELKLSNVEIVQARVEEYQVDVPFDVVISRAFSELQQMIRWTSQLLALTGQWVAMKGKIPHDELVGLRHPYTVHSYEVPGLDSERCVVCVSKTVGSL